MLAGSATAPRVLARERIEMAEPRLAGSRQPYHQLEGLPLAEARRRLPRYEASAEALAREGLDALAARARAAGADARAAGILEASGRAGATLEVILASHALIHAADGNHFRAALTRGCQALGLPVTRVPQRELTGRAAAALGKTPDEMGTAVSGLGRGLGAPWGADQKGAALLAWLLLATGG
jgi:hypothetical protein